MFNCGMDEKGLGRLLARDTPCLVLVSSQSLLALISRRSRPISRGKQIASSLYSAVDHNTEKLKKKILIANV